MSLRPHAQPPPGGLLLPAPLFSPPASLAIPRGATVLALLALCPLGLSHRWFPCREDPFHGLEPCSICVSSGSSGDSGQHSRGSPGPCQSATATEMPHDKPPGRARLIPRSCIALPARAGDSHYSVGEGSPIACQWPHVRADAAEEQEASTQSLLPRLRPAPPASRLPRGLTIPAPPPLRTHARGLEGHGGDASRTGGPGNPVCSGDRPGVFVGISPAGGDAGGVAEMGWSPGWEAPCLDPRWPA